MVGIPTIGLFFYNHGVLRGWMAVFLMGMRCAEGGSSASPKRIEVVPADAPCALRCRVVRMGLRGVMRLWRIPG